MNLPNKLTVLRMCMIPVFLLCFYLPLEPQGYLLALVTFAAASATDTLDGHLARKHNLITDFGKLMDPLADKLLVTAALCCLLPEYGIPGTLSLVLILSREFLVTSMRLLAAGKNIVLAADFWGKLKTVAQMAWICLALFAKAFPNLPAVAVTTLTGLLGAMFFFMLALTVISGARYIWKNKELFIDSGIEENDS